MLFKSHQGGCFQGWGGQWGVYGRGTYGMGVHNGGQLLGEGRMHSSLFLPAIQAWYWQCSVLTINLNLKGPILIAICVYIYGNTVLFHAPPSVFKTTDIFF